MIAMRSLAIIALLFAGTSCALAQNAPPTNAIRLPPLVHRGRLQRMSRPHWALSPEHQDGSIRVATELSCRSLAITGISLTGGRKASGICLPLAAWNAGVIGANQSAIIA